MFLILSGDPELARKSVLRDPKVSFWDKAKVKVSLAELLSWAADGYIAGKEHNVWESRVFPPRCPYSSLYDHNGKENPYYGLDPLRKVWHAWLGGFEQGLKDNPSKPKVKKGLHGDYQVIEYA